MRKAQTQTTIVTLILFLVVAVILIIFAGRLTDLLNESRAKEVCKVSMLASSKTKVGGMQTLDLKCKMQVFDIKSDGVYENQNKITSFTKETNIEDAVKRAVADRISDCWYMANEGSVNPFGEWSNKIIAKSNLCVLCSRINFDKSLIGKISPQLDLTKWYNETKMTGKDVTYYQYAPTHFGNPLDTSKGYYVVYSVASYSRWRSVIGLATRGLLASSGLVGYIIDKTALSSDNKAGIIDTFIKQHPFMPSLFIIPPDSVQNVCQKIAN